MENKELNNKVAEFAGIRVLGIVPADEYWGEIDMTGFAVYPDSIVAMPLCNFPESLDACFKWLVPEVVKRYGLVVIRMELLASVFRAIKEDESPSLALCKAVEKLIDKVG